MNIYFEADIIIWDLCFFLILTPFIMSKWMRNNPPIYVHSLKDSGTFLHCTDYKGELCDEGTDACTPSPCINGGTCLVSVPSHP